MALVVKCRKCGRKLRKQEQALQACPGCGAGDLRYIIDYWPRGRRGGRKQLTLPRDVTNKEAALAFERDFCAILSTRNDGKKPQARPSTVADLFPDYLDWYKLHRSASTWKDVSGAWERDLKRILGDYQVTEISGEHYLIYQKIRSGQVSARTVNKELDYFSGFLRWCRREKGLPVERVVYEGLPYNKPLPMVLSPGETARILEAAQAEPVYHALFGCLYLLGLRSAEARGIRIADLDFANRTVVVQQKGGAYKLLPINDRVIEAIRAAMVWREGKVKSGKGWKATPYVFSVRKDGEPIQNMRKAIARICAAAGVTKPVHPHLFRHSIATHLLGADVNLRTIQQYLGHTQISTTEVYTHVAMAHLRRAQDAIGLYENNE